MSAFAHVHGQGADLEFGVIASADPASIAAGAVGTVVLAVSGADTNDTVFVTPRALATGLVVVEATVTDTDEVTVTLLNTSASPVDDAASSYDYMLVKRAATA